MIPRRILLYCSMSMWRVNSILELAETVRICDTEIPLNPELFEVTESVVMTHRSRAGYSVGSPPEIAMWRGCGACYSRWRCEACEGAGSTFTVKF